MPRLAVANQLRQAPDSRYAESRAAMPSPAVSTHPIAHIPACPCILRQAGSTLTQVTCAER